MLCIGIASNQSIDASSPSHLIVVSCAHAWSVCVYVLEGSSLSLSPSCLPLLISLRVSLSVSLFLRENPSLLTRYNRAF